MRQIDHPNTDLKSAQFSPNFAVMMYWTLNPEQVSLSEFITYWQQHYDYGNEEIYKKVIQQVELMPDDIIALFNWKNNMGMAKDRLSGKKQVFVEKVLTRIDKVNQLKKSFDFDQYMGHFDDLPAIWGITLLHVVSSGTYPIYDQHVHRAFTYCSKRTVEEIPVSNSKKYKVYRQVYVPFFNNLRQQAPHLTPKEIDDALWALGKFLSRYPKMFPQDIRL